VAVVVSVEAVEYTHNDGVGVPLLKLWRLLQEFKARVLFEQVFKEGLEVFCYYCLRAVSRNQLKQSPLGVFPMEVLALEESDELLLIYLGFAAKFGKGAHLLLDSREEHFGEYLGHLEYFLANRPELIDSQTLPCRFAKNFVHVFIELCHKSLVYRFASREVELRHDFVVGHIFRISQVRWCHSRSNICILLHTGSFVQLGMHTRQQISFVSHLRAALWLRRVRNLLLRRSCLL